MYWWPDRRRGLTYGNQGGGILKGLNPQNCIVQVLAPWLTRYKVPKYTIGNCYKCKMHIMLSPPPPSNYSPNFRLCITDIIHTIYDRPKAHTITQGLICQMNLILKRAQVVLVVLFLTNIFIFTCSYTIAQVYLNRYIFDCIYFQFLKITFQEPKWYIFYS